MILYGNAPLDKCIHYGWGNYHMKSTEWHDALTTALLEISSTTDINVDELNLNSCLINKFADGFEHSPMHQDKKMGTRKPDTVILIALGAPRPFQFQSVEKPTSTNTITLTPGMVLLFTPTCNRYFKHGRPTAEYITQPSFSVTFRNTIQKQNEHD